MAVERTFKVCLLEDDFIEEEEKHQLHFIVDSIAEMHIKYFQIKGAVVLALQIVI